MKLQELREQVNNPTLDPNMQVWLGTDAGEGYPRLVSVIVENAKYVDLDGDDVDGEQDYENDIFQNILVLGEYRTIDDIRYNKLKEQQRIDSEQEIIILNSNPDYQKYLELKERFGN